MTNKADKVVPEVVHRLKNSEEDTEGLDAALIVSNGKLILDFTKSIQHLELDAAGAKRMIDALLMAGAATFTSEAIAERKKISLH